MIDRQRKNASIILLLVSFDFVLDDVSWKKEKSLHKRSTLMLFSTLPDLPGRAYDVIGVVVSQTWLRPNGDDRELHEMFNRILGQASDMKADAIIDIKMTAPSGTSNAFPAIVVTGTAIKLR